MPAVIAMQGNLTTETASVFMPTFFTELRRDGQVDRAMAVARGTVRDRPDWWVPVLYMNLKRGHIEFGVQRNRKNDRYLPTATFLIPKPVKQPQPSIKKSTGPNDQKAIRNPRPIRTVPFRLPLLEIDWTPVPAGKFTMGSDREKDSQAQENEAPQHIVDLPEYAIAIHPITHALYARFVKATGHLAPANWVGEQAPAGKDNHPVVAVSWFDATAYCKWASAETGRAISLPTEAQWEKAARGTHRRIWPWGNTPPTALLCNFDRYRQGTSPVGDYPQGGSPYGVLDLAGNAWEWTSSPGRSYPYRAPTAEEESALDLHRVLRGGSYFNHADTVRCAYRLFYAPHGARSDFGFRVVLNS